MRTNNPAQLKQLIRNIAAKKNLPTKYVMQNYLLERFLERLSVSEYRNNFVIKGGFLISAIVGLDTRATMDLDTTVKGLPLTHESIKEIFQTICAIEVEDDIVFEVAKTSDIRKGNDYPGVRVSLNAKYGRMDVALTIDVTTGDKITPREIEFFIPTMFGEG